MAHAQVLATGTQHLPDQVTVAAEPVLVQAARRLDPGRLRRSRATCSRWPTPQRPARSGAPSCPRRGLWLAPTFEGMVAVDGLLEPEAGQSLLAALEPLARPADAHDTRSGSQRNADALAELARRALEGGRLPQTGGVRPQLSVIVDLDSLVGHPGAVGGEVGWAGPLDPEACRRLACDGAVTRVLVTRQPLATTTRPPPDGQARPATHDPSGEAPPEPHHPNGTDGLQPGSRPPRPCYPRPWAAPPPNPWRSAGPPGSSNPPNAPPWPSAMAAVSSPTATRPLAWCDAHHLRHWLHGGPTDLANLALLCRTHHRAVHEGGGSSPAAPTAG